MDRQDLDENSRSYGGILSAEYGLASPNHSTGTPMTMAIWAASLCNPDSPYYRDEELAARFALAARYMVGAQHEDGTISPGWTNFHSPPDTAFVVVGYAQVYQLLAQDDWAPLREAAADVRLFLERTIPALVTGGVHTPNHRWVVSAALGFLHELFGAPETLQRAEQWIAEGMDITPDGEWTERSNGIYNAVSDIMLVHAARLFGKPELLAPVRANLRMMLYLVHPNGDVVTDYSGRQDFGHKHDLSSYYLPYAMMAHLDENAEFQAAANLAYGQLRHPGSCPTNAAVRLLLDPSLREQAVRPAELPTEYRKLLHADFPRQQYLAAMESAGHNGRIYHSRLHPDFGAAVARVRKGDESVTISAETPSFFALRHGAARLLGVQVATYFAPGFVPMNSLVEAEGGYRLAGEQHKGYYGPVTAERLPSTAAEATSPWYLLPHHQREETHVQRLRVAVDVVEAADGWELVIRSSEPEELMTQISVILAADGELSGGELAPAGAGKQFWKSGTLRYEAGGDALELSGGAYAHTAGFVREANLPFDCQTLLLNVVTPFETRIRIRTLPRA
ncbi:hypothetical protein OMP38_09815 [Cohnella ginsengisoli]|uniref:Uncharacterized protein n=2 Tax=Cohnella ginsengisoli TaxID=425004 RepID=A0A9X4QMA9_9BACL|nr:hypothetical protein [Cohnella ginsengisoli]MDG0791135.1 hypothetical protein [Cohnella ginsengisoli]